MGRKPKKEWAERGARIRELRLERNWSQTELGERMGGLRQAAIQYIETGINNVSADHLIQLKEIFNTTYNFLLEGEGKSTSSENRMKEILKAQKYLAKASSIISGL